MIRTSFAVRLSAPEGLSPDSMSVPARADERETNSSPFAHVMPAEYSRATTRNAPMASAERASAPPISLDANPVQSVHGRKTSRASAAPYRMTSRTPTAAVRTAASYRKHVLFVSRSRRSTPAVAHRRAQTCDSAARGAAPEALAAINSRTVEVLEFAPGDTLSGSHRLAQERVVVLDDAHRSFEGDVFTANHHDHLAFVRAEDTIASQILHRGQCRYPPS